MLTTVPKRRAATRPVLLMPVPQAHDAGPPRHTTHSSAAHRFQAEPAKRWVPKPTRKLNLQNYYYYLYIIIIIIIYLIYLFGSLLCTLRMYDHYIT